MWLYVVQAEPITIIMGSPEMFIGMFQYSHDLIYWALERASEKNCLFYTEWISKAGSKIFVQISYRIWINNKLDLHRQTIPRSANKHRVDAQGRGELSVWWKFIFLIEISTGGELRQQSRWNLGDYREKWHNNFISFNSTRQIKGQWRLHLRAI